MELDLRKKAQRRADRIAVFRAELAELEAEKGLVLTEVQREQLDAHYRHLLAELGLRFGVDVTESARRASWGMRVAALLAGAAFVAAMILFLHRFWGHLPGAVQVGMLTLAPLVPLLGAAWTARRQADTYYTALLSLAAGVMFVVGLNALGAVLNLAPSPHALFAWGLFAVLVAHAFGLRLLLGLGLVQWCLYGGALWVAARGGHWEAFMEHTRGLIPVALVLYAVPLFAYRADPRGFGFVYRLCGAGVALGALLIESVGGDLCCGDLAPGTARVLFQVIGLVLSAGVVWHGLRVSQGGLVNLGAALFVAFLYARLHAWWWDWMPKYLFFLLLGLCGIGLVLAFRRLRSGLAERAVP